MRWRKRVRPREGSSSELLRLVRRAHHHHAPGGARRWGPPVPLHLGSKRRGNSEHLGSVAEVTRIGEIPRALRSCLRSCGWAAEYRHIGRQLGSRRVWVIVHLRRMWGGVMVRGGSNLLRRQRSHGRPIRRHCHWCGVHLLMRQPLRWGRRLQVLRGTRDGNRLWGRDGASISARNLVNLNAAPAGGAPAR